MIDRLTVDKIMDAANIVDVVGEFVNLRKAGVNYKGLCPFHDDKTPSFMVSPAKNICHCFACGKGGTPVSFLMEHEQITYPEALRWLAKKYNIEIEERELSDEERREQSERESMFIVNEWAKDYFHDILNNDIDGQAIGKQYFRSRGIRDDIMRKFALGYSPAKRDAMSTAAIAKGYKPEFLLKTGLCYERNQVDKLTSKQVDKLSDTESLTPNPSPKGEGSSNNPSSIFPSFGGVRGGFSSPSSSAPSHATAASLTALAHLAFTTSLAHATACLSGAKEVHAIVYGEHGVAVDAVCLGIAAAVGIGCTVDIALLLEDVEHLERNGKRFATQETMTNLHVPNQFVGVERGVGISSSAMVEYL